MFTDPIECQLHAIQPLVGDLDLMAIDLDGLDVEDLEGVEVLGQALLEERVVGSAGAGLGPS